MSRWRVKQLWWALFVLETPDWNNQGAIAGCNCGGPFFGRAIAVSHENHWIFVAQNYFLLDFVVSVLRKNRNLTDLSCAQKELSISDCW